MENVSTQKIYWATIQHIWLHILCTFFHCAAYLHKSTQEKGKKWVERKRGRKKEGEKEEQ